MTLDLTPGQLHELDAALPDGWACHVADKTRTLRNVAARLVDVAGWTPPPPPPALTAEPPDAAARVIDRDGDVWARWQHLWGCLTYPSKPQAWGDLVNVCGPLRRFEADQ